MFERFFSRRFAPLLVSLILLIAAFPPFYVGWLVFVALVPWLVHLKGLSTRQAVRSGFWFGFVFYLFQLVWLFTLVGKWTGNLWLTLLPWILSGVAGGGYFCIQAWLIKACYASFKPGWIPFVWAGMEVLRSYIPQFAFPWGLLATPLWRTPQIIQHAALGTLFLVSAWVVLVNVVLAEFLCKVPWKKQAWRLGVIGILLVYSILRYSAPPTHVMQKTITAGQVGVDLAFMGSAEAQEHLQRNLKYIFDRAKNSDLLVLSEGLAYTEGRMPPMTPFLNNPPVPTLFGGQRSDGPVYQTAFAYDRGKWTYADKTRLVIFGEFVPLRDVLPFLDAFQLPQGDLTPGDRIQTLTFNGIKVGPLLCFEALFPSIALTQTEMGANLLAIMSMDDWFMDTPAIDQLRAAAVWRAVESGLPVVRSASLGVTMIVDARGNVLQEAPLKRVFALTEKLKLPQDSDAFTYRWVFVWLTSLVSLWTGVSTLFKGFFKDKGTESA
jgi:apolipoprotein N-acyltransferase